MKKLVSLFLLLPFGLVSQKKISKQHVDIYYPNLVETRDIFQKNDNVVAFTLNLGYSTFEIHTLNSCYFEDSNLIIINSSDIFPDSIILVGSNFFIIRNDKTTLKRDTVNMDTLMVFDGLIEVKSLLVFDKRINKCIMLDPILFENKWPKIIRKRKLKKNY